MFRSDVEHRGGPPRRRRPRVQHDVHRLAKGLDARRRQLRGSGPPLRFALVPVMGRPSPSASERGTGWSGSRTATFHPRAVTSGGTASDTGRTSVRPPGQNASAKAECCVRHARCHHRQAAQASEMRSGSGMPCGRPFASKTRSTAASFSASAPSPYRVSVGKATRPPARSVSTAAAMSAVAECDVTQAHFVSEMLAH